MPGNFQITSFDYRREAVPGELTDTCWGETLNTGDDDYGGVIIIDSDTSENIQAGVTDVPIHSGSVMSWPSEADYPMPDRDVNATALIGYYVPAESTVYVTDTRDFTIMAKVGAAIPWTYIAIGGGAILAALLFVKRKK